MRIRRKKDHIRHGYAPWYSVTEDEPSFVGYVHHGAQEDVPFPDSSWSYTRSDSPFLLKERSDQDLHFKILDTLYRSPAIDSSRITVLVHNGAVLLSGEVTSELERKSVELLVKGLPEVWGIENKISVDLKTS
jgi:hypothetical protein